MRVRLGQRTAAFPIVTQRSGFIFPSVSDGVERRKQLGKTKPGAGGRLTIHAISVENDVAVTRSDPVVPRHRKVRTQPIDGVERESTRCRAARVGEIVATAILESLSHAIHVRHRVKDDNVLPPEPRRLIREKKLYKTLHREGGICLVSVLASVPEDSTLRL